MKNIARLCSFLLLLALFIGIYNQARAEPGVWSPPGDFGLVSAAPGVALYQKNYANGSPDYVQVADLSLGVRVGVLHGEIINPGNGGGVYGGDNPRFNRLSIQQFWNKFSTSLSGAFCVSNGQFFRLADSPTPLPFPLKQGGEIRTDGYGIKEFPGQKLMLEIWPDHLDIRELSQEALYSSSAPDIVAGLSEDAEKASKKVVGRTFIGIDDRDGDDGYETLLIFNTRTARPQAAVEVLRSFGAEKVMMLDGGGSTQLICQDQVMINTDRLIPQALGIAAADLPPLAASLPGSSSIPVFVIGEAWQFPIQLRNIGSQTWLPVNTQINLESNEPTMQTNFSLVEQVASGEKTTYLWQIPSIDQAGIHQVRISIMQNGERVGAEPGVVSFVVLPAELANLAPELRAQLVHWSAQSGIDLAGQVQSWIQEKQITQAGEKAEGELANDRLTSQEVIVQAGDIQLANIIWIPLLMVPLFTIILAVIRQVQAGLF
jgi:hypothetical protein